MIYVNFSRSASSCVLHATNIWRTRGRSLET